MSDAQDARAAVAAGIVLLRDSYLKSLPAELADMARIAADLTGDAQDRAALDELHRRLHKLSGSGGTFGLIALSAEAQRLELAVNTWLNGAPDYVEVEDLRAFVAAVVALDQALADDAARIPH